MNNIDKTKFKLVSQGTIHDTKFSTKPVSFFADAMYRFSRNKSSVVAAIIIVLLILYSIITPLIYTLNGTDIDASWNNADFKYVSPKLKAFEGTEFWSGAKRMNTTEKGYDFYHGIGYAAMQPNGEDINYQDAVGTKLNPVKKLYSQSRVGSEKYYTYLVDSYYAKGFLIKSVSKAEFEKIRQWEDDTGKYVIYPMVDLATSNGDNNWNTYKDDNYRVGNYWYKMNTDGTAKLDGEDNYIDHYRRNKAGEIQYYVAGGSSGENYTVRVLAYNFFEYTNGFEPSFAFGLDAYGFDISARLASGIRLSLLLAVSVSLVNLIVGAFIGAHAGYFGGWVDMTIERITDILNALPFMVVLMLFKMYFIDSGKVSSFVGVLLAFVALGWIGTSSLVRMQFYRFKNMEYIMAARTLGAGNYRLMFKHIFPNAIGTMITSSVLVIPGVIASESMLSYLGIIELGGMTQTSIGTMLAAGRSVFEQYPHILLFPAVVISLLMICFNLVGNGLRDAFNPSLRGME